MAVSLLTSWQPERGRKCYVTPASSGVPNAKRGEQKQKWWSPPCLLEWQKEGGNALPPLPSRGSPTLSVGSKIRNGCLAPDSLAAQKRAEMLRHPCILGDPQRQARGAKSKVAISPLPSLGAKRGRKCLASHAFSEVPNAKSGEQNQTWLPHPCLIRRPKRGRKCYVTPACSGVHNAKRGDQKQKWLFHPCLLGGQKEGGNALPPLPSRGSPTPNAGCKIRNGCLTPDFLAARKRAEMLRHPCMLGGPPHQARGAKSEMVVSLLTSW